MNQSSLHLHNLISDSPKMCFQEVAYLGKKEAKKLKRMGYMIDKVCK